jgi:PAS domain S-box-containing protein
VAEKEWTTQALSSYSYAVCGRRRVSEVWSARHIDLEGHFIRANKKLCEAVRYDREELLRKTFDDITHPDDLQSNRDRMRQLLSGEIDDYSMDERCVRKDGLHLWVNLNVSLARHASGGHGIS